MNHHSHNHNHYAPPSQYGPPPGGYNYGQQPAGYYQPPQNPQVVYVQKPEHHTSSGAGLGAGICCGLLAGCCCEELCCICC